MNRFQVLFICILGLIATSCFPFLNLGSKTTLRIVSGSENQTLEPIVTHFAQQNGVEIETKYKGSLDIMLMLQEGTVDYDAIWPANSLWISLGDKNHLVKDSESIMRSPVVLGVKKSVAQKLGWIGKDVRVNDILNAAENSKLKLMMTSATQSNSGASAYFGFLYAFAGNPPVLTSDNLKDPNMRAQVKRILGAVNRTAESSGWLRDLFLKDYDQYDAMFNYEALVIEMNQELVKNRQEPLYAIYPVDGLAIADSPLAFVNKGNADKEPIFLKLQQYLLSSSVQQEILEKGRRAGLVGLNPNNVNRNVFNPDWGIDVSRVLNPIKFPSAPVISEALDLYQTALRKASLTTYCLDYSPSMRENDGYKQLVSALDIVWNQDNARKYLLQAAPDDLTIALLFGGSVFNYSQRDKWTVRGNNPSDFNRIYTLARDTDAQGSTAIYSCVIQALQTTREQMSPDRFPAVILMTDGQSNAGSSYNDFQRYLNSMPNNIPVFAITFGNASTTELERITSLTHGRVYDGTKDLITAFRQAKGNN